MKKLSTIIIVLVLISIAVHGLEIKLDRISKDVTLVRGIIEPGYTQNLIVITTQKGLIAIDTGFPLDVARKMKTAIEKQLGRDDFIYLINTHGHMDHSIGNQLYDKAVKIAHVNAGREMKKNVREWGQKYFTKDFNVTPPDITFKKFLRLKVDKITLNLYYPGPSHTDSHILIHVPELDILCVGDCFHNSSPPYVDKAMDLSGMINTLEALADKISSKTKVLPGHRKMFHGDFIKATLNYFKALRREVKLAQSQNINLEKARKLILKKIPRHGLENVTHWTKGKNVDEIFLQNIEAAWGLLKRKNRLK